MRMQFDLRPSDLIEKEGKNTALNPIRLVVILLFLLFLSSSGFYLVNSTFEVLDLKSSVESKQSEVSRLEADRVALEAEITRLQQRERMFTDALKIMQEDLPTLEMFKALETYAEPGMRFFDLRYAAPQVMLNARADTEEQITLFRVELENSGVFSKVDMPTSKLDEKTRKVLFTLNLTLLPIGQIRNSAER